MRIKPSYESKYATNANNEVTIQIDDSEVLINPAPAEVTKSKLRARKEEPDGAIQFQVIESSASSKLQSGYWVGKKVLCP